MRSAVCAGGANGWAAALNGNLDTIDALLYSHQTSIDGHTGTGGNKHNADHIRTPDGSDVQSTLAAKAGLHHSHQSDDIILPDNQDLGHHIDGINDSILVLQNGKADVAHEHSEYALQTALDTVENTLDLLLPDLGSVTLSVDVVNRSGGIRILFSTTPQVHFSQAEILIEKDGVEVHHETVLSTSVFIAGSELSGVENGDVINISVTLYSGLSSKIKKIDHTYATTTSPLEERIETIETQLTLGNIIDAFAQDEDALQALANVLHSSNTLAQSKISGLTTALAAKVETRTKINGHALEGDIKLETTDIIAEVTELPEEGVIGEVVAYGGKLYVWSGDK